jgi:hypothetical protein
MAFTLQCKLAVNGSLKMESPDFVIVIMPLICFPTTTIPLADIKSQKRPRNNSEAGREPTPVIVQLTGICFRKQPETKPKPWTDALCSRGGLLSGGYWLGEEPWDWESLMPWPWPCPCPDVASSI